MYEIFVFFVVKNQGKGSVITCDFFLIDVFFDVDFKSIIVFRRSHVFFELWRPKIARKNLSICKKI